MNEVVGYSVFVSIAIGVWWHHEVWDTYDRPFSEVILLRTVFCQQSCEVCDAVECLRDLKIKQHSSLPVHVFKWISFKIQSKSL
jgi:hypothetical protein